jgi:hypothetical protein
MKNIITLRFPILLAALLLAFGLVTRAQAQTTNTPPASTGTNSLALLEQAYTALMHSDHDYDGHVAEAESQIKSAAHELGGKVTAKNKPHEKQAASDDQLKSAKELLQQVEPNVSGKALKHVQTAIEQIDKALAVRAKK